MWATGVLRGVDGDTSLTCILPEDTCAQHDPAFFLTSYDRQYKYWNHVDSCFLYRTDHYDLKDAMDGDTVIFNWRPH